MGKIKWFVSKLHRVHDQESGNVALLVALSMVAICGFASLVVDVGGLYVQRQHAQTGADAGALAGADTLLQGASTAAANAFQMASTNDPHPTYTAVADTNSQTVTVSAKQTVPLWFARVLCFDSSSLHVTSKAQIGTLVSAVGVVPIGVPDQTFTYGQKVYLSQGAGNGDSGNYGFLDLSGRGSCGLETDIERGYNSSLDVGEQVNTKPGVMAGPVEQAITYRMSEDDSESCQSFETATSNCGRVMLLPVINTLDVSGTKPVTILGFAAFYLEGLVGTGGQQQVCGRFIQMVRPGQLGVGTNYGTYGVKLTAP